MKVLLVSNQRYNAQGVGNPIIYRIQNATLADKRVDVCEFLPFENSLGCLKEIRSTAKRFDVVHVHFGGLYALLIRFWLLGLHCHFFITFHGTDIHAKAIKQERRFFGKLKIRLNQWASFASIPLYDRSGFVAEEMMEYLPNLISQLLSKRMFIQKLGVDYSTFLPMNKTEAQRKLGLEEGNYILFSDVSNTPIKRRDIAQSIAEHLPEWKLLIMCSVKPEDVPNYINACDMLLLTSDQEGSPNIIRECLALNKPVFSVDVGDAKEQINGLKKSAIIPRNPTIASAIISQNMANCPNDDSRTILRNKIDLAKNTSKIIDLYHLSIAE